jgi:hypothetical protein
MFWYTPYQRVGEGYRARIDLHHFPGLALGLAEDGDELRVGEEGINGNSVVMGVFWETSGFEGDEVCWDRMRLVMQVDGRMN